MKTDVFKDIKATYKQDTVDAKVDKFSIDNIQLTGIKDDGSEVALNPNIYTWSDDMEGELEEGHNFIYSESHLLTPTEPGSFTIECQVNVTNDSAAGEVDPNLNEDFYFSEAENLDIDGQSATLVQTGDDYTKDYKTTNCDFASFRAAAYLGYTGKYEASGKGFVLGFDQTESDNRNMSMTFNVPGGGSANLIVRRATNVSTGTYTSGDLNVTKAAKIVLNSTDITSSLNQEAKFEGIKDPTPDAQNRIGTVENMSLEGRFRFVNWTEVNLGRINLRRGTNKITFYSANGTSSGHWDYIKIDVKPYSKKVFVRFFQKIYRWWLGVWYEFNDKHPKFASLLYKIGFFFLFSMAMTLWQYLVMLFLPYAFSSIWNIPFLLSSSIYWVKGFARK